MLPFMMKAAVATLKKFPEFNASLDGDNLVLKNYWHIGFAADTPQRPVVPVIRDADKKGVPEIAKEMGDLAKLARDGKLKPDQMQGGTFTISLARRHRRHLLHADHQRARSRDHGRVQALLEAASRPTARPRRWRLTLPLSLSWDHRVIDGAAAARFNVHFANLLADMRRMLF